MKVGLIVAVSLFLASSQAADYGQTRGAATRCANWILSQYSDQDRVFKTGPDGATPELAAMIVKGLCESPRDYRESNGPYISGPVKAILASINEKNELNGAKIGQAEALMWVVSALKVTENPKYAPIIEKLRAHAKELTAPAVPELKLELLSPATADRESLRNALSAIHKFHETNGKELEVGGQKVKWAEVLSGALLKLQKPDGSFGEDLQTNALALYALNLCYRALK